MRANERAEPPDRQILALGLLAGLLPFELKEPLFRVGGLAITNVELTLYAALFLWAFHRLRLAAAPLHWTRVHTAVAAWAAVLVVSAICAPSARGAAVKFSLRSLGGCALFFAAADVLRTPVAVAKVSLAMVAGAVVSAVAALAEVALPEASVLLAAFKTQTTLVGSFVRASGTFQYANIGAMYWEATFPLLLGLCGWWAGRQTSSSRRLVAALGTLVVAEAVVLSASRAAWLVLALLLLALAGVSVRSVSLLRRPVAIGLACLTTLMVVSAGASPWLLLRLRSEREAAWYQVVYDPVDVPSDVRAGEPFVVRLTVRNVGLLTWPAGADQPVRLGYHWYDPEQEQTVLFDGQRTALPADVPPGGQVTFDAAVLAPPQAGSYTLQLDMVQEGLLWFSDHGAETGDIPLRVRPAPAGMATQWPAVALPPVIQPQPRRLELWRAGLRMWRKHPLLGVGPDNFRHLYGSYLGRMDFDDRLHANSLYVETLATTGLAGALALIGLMGTLWQAARRVFATARDPAVGALVAGVLAGLAAFFLHGSVDYFFEFTPTYGLFWLLAGATSGLAAAGERSR